MIKKTISLVLSFLVFLFCQNALSDSTRLLSVEQVKKMVEDPSQISNLPQLSEEHPDYPLVTLLSTLKADLNKNPQQVIQKLENLMTQQNFEAVHRADRESNSDTAKPNLKKVEGVIGTIGSYGLWRELGYLLMGRAYYETGNFKMAIHYLDGIPADSPFATIATLDRRLSQIKTDALGDDSSLLQSLHASSLQNSEFQLQQAFSALRRNQIDESISIAQAVSFPKGVLLEGLRKKLIIEAEFKSYMAKSNALDFDQKKKILERLIAEAEGVPSKDRDSEFSFLAAEIYWYQASVHRLKDPVKYQSIGKTALERADQWIRPWAEKSITQKQAFLTEEALFFSASVLWEQEKFSSALERLEAIPRLFPKGIYREDAYQLLGDYFYDKGNFRTALSHYRELAKIGSVEKASYGVYKAAWSFYHLQEKWQALRHMERILKSHWASSQESTNITQEAEKDMLLFLAELLPSDKANAELDIFSLNDDAKLALREKLAAAYKNLGKYEESSKMWRFLLEKNPSMAKSFDWLHELLLCELSLGKRELMAPSIEEYWNKLPSDNADFEKKVVKLILTNHKEARKTDDPKLWKSTDSLYRVFAKYFPNSQNGEIWFYGAQYLEKASKKWDAVQWYQKAANLPAYEARWDAALSVLRFIKNRVDEKSVEKKSETANEYAKITETAKWFTDAFREKKERSVAETIYLEALYKNDQFQQAKDYLVDVIKSEGASASHREQFSALNRLLYHAKKWNWVYDLAKSVSEAMPASTEKSDKFYSDLINIQQEGAFESAFSTQTKPEARNWYRKTIESSSNTNVALKSWHNLLVSYLLPDEISAFKNDYDLFEKRYFKSEKPVASSELKEDERELLLNILLKSADAQKLSGQPLERAKTLMTASRFQEEGTTREAMIWDATVVFGTYYDLENFQKLYQGLVKDKSKLIDDKKNRYLAAKLLFLNGLDSDAWEILAKNLKEDFKNPENGILFYDLYSANREKQSPLLATLNRFLKDNRVELLKNTTLEPVFAAQEIQTMRVLLASMAPDRNVAAEPSSDQDLKTRLKKVSQALAKASQVKNELKKNLESPLAHVSIQSVCLASEADRAAASELKKLSEPKIEGPSWNSFETKLNQKIASFNQSGQQEQSLCDQRTSVFPFIGSKEQEKTALFCESGNCFPDRPEHVAATPSSHGLLDQIHMALQGGNWARAEELAYSAPNVAEKSLYLAYLRMTKGDTWNAYPLLVEAEKDYTTAPRARLLLAYWAQKKGARTLATEKLSNLNENSFSTEREKNLWNEIQK